MKPIGGYFELELRKGNSRYHDTPYRLKSGRSSLHFILSIIRPEVVYIPYFTCDALLEPFTAAGVKYSFYAINEQFEIAKPIDLKRNEYLLYINYLDQKRAYTNQLSAQYGDRLIIDGTQAFFMKGDGRSWLFNSCRKFFGVPDGSYLYSASDIQATLPVHSNEGYRTEHLIQRFNGHAREGYESFLVNETLCDSAITGMSKLSEHLLSHTDYDAVMKQRIENYRYLDEAFRDVNLFSAATAKGQVPMNYPLLSKEKVDRSILFSSDIFIPTFWPHVWERNMEGFETEIWLANHLLPLPVDHRLDKQDMDRMAGAVLALLKK